MRLPAIFKKVFFALFCCIYGLFFPEIIAQNTVYTAPYTSADFTKTINVSLPVGTIAAAADVSSGSASYTIPIAVPPGTNGVAPSVSIVYSSMSGSGQVGYGWSIGGLSSISRAAQTIYHNGATKAVELNTDDRFVLDGARLFAKSGTYGANGTTYGTETENFATITSYGNFGGDPDWFRVEAKDGTVMQYSNAAYSRFDNQAGTEGLVWRLSKIEYKDGNYIEFKYTNADRDSRIDEINYTGNVAAGLAPYNKLKFNYSIRTDVNTTYEANASYVSKYLLDNIVVTAEGAAAFKTYTFKYAWNGVNSLLKEVVESGSNGTSLNSTIFKYGDEPTAFQTGSASAIAGQSVDLLSGDFNGDGYSDLVAATRNLENGILYHTDFKVYKKIPSQTNHDFTLGATQTFPTINNSAVLIKQGMYNGHNFFTGDFNGDGSDDIGTMRTTGSGSSRILTDVKIYNTINDGNAFSTPTNITLPGSGSYNKIHTSSKFMLGGDFNGDGIMDMFSMLGHNTSGVFAGHMYYGNSSAYFGTLAMTGTPNFPMSMWPSVDQLHILDFNGDGRSDLMVVNDGLCEIFTFDGYYVRRLYVRAFPNDYHLIFFGDFNGDRKTDMLVRNSLTNLNAPWYKHISTGTDFIEYPFTFSKIPDINSAYYGDKLVISDFNGDGKMDISHCWNYWVTQSSLASKIDMYYSRGDNFVTEQTSYAQSFVTSPNNASFDFNGDGRSDLMNRGAYTNPFDILYFEKNGKELLLEKVKNGVDHTTEWTYKRLTEAGSFYTRGSLTAQPVNNVQLPLNLVSDFKAQNGIGGNTTVQYSYEEAKFHKEGKGFLGLKKITANNLATGIKTVSEQEFNTTFYAAAPYKTSTYLASNNSLISETTLTNQFQQQDFNYYEKRYWVKTNSSYENKAFEGRFVSSSMTYDAYGNATQSTVNNNNVVSTTTTAVYGTFGTPIPAKPTSVTTSTTRTGQAAYSATNIFTYNSLGQLTGKTEFSGRPQSVSTTYTYNNLGNQTGMTVTPSGMTARSGSMGYDAKGRFATSAVNALGQTATSTFDARWGKPLSETGIDGLTVSYQYDAFGRLTTTTLPTGFNVTNTYGWDVNTSEGTIHYKLTAHPGKPDVKVWYDLLDREKKTETEGFQNLWITQKTTYDARGNVATATAPYKSGETVLTTTNAYDAYNRPISASNTIGTTTYAYSYASGNLTVSITNPAGQVSSKVTDADNQIVSATDYGGTLTYTYNSQGNLLDVKQGTTVLALNEYDEYGRQTKLTDLNAGVTQYTYNALGQMTTQISALGQTTTNTYDLLGRPVQRVGPEGTTTYEYFSSGSGAATNKIKKITGFAGELQEYTYDAFGRISTDKITVDATAHQSAYTYNTYSDVSSMTYPSGFALNYTYDANGYLNTLKNGANTVTLFTNTGMNGFNQYTGYSLGNGKTSANSYYFGTPTRYLTSGVQDLNLNWNYQSGNLTSRYDAIKSKTESFTYDNLNRLLSSSGTGLSTINMTYAGNGNVSTKTDAGTYAYGSAKINAVTSVTNPAANIPLVVHNVSYTAYFQPSLITEGSHQATLTYAADYQRIKSVLTQSGATVNTRYYFGGYEKDISGGTTKHLHYINAGQGLIAIVVRESGADTYYYTYTDHLGSILTATNSSGTVIAEQNFDAWGRKRNTSTWGYTGVQSVPSWLYRGFTGHEHLPQFGLINMNGRLYDPIVGRMLSPDNNVQMPDFTQNYNRYSYALNNPLRFTDPDGEWIHILAGALIGGFINGIAHADKGLGGFAKGFAIGAVAGAVTAATGGLAVGALGLASTGVVSGIVSGASGAILGGPIQGIGNSLVFGDRYSAKQWGKDILLSGAIGGVVGGVAAGIQNLRGTPTNIWTGGKPGTGSSIWSFSNRPQNNLSEIEVGQLTYKSEGCVSCDKIKGVMGSESVQGPALINTSGLNPTHYVTMSQSAFKSLYNDIKINGIKEALPYVEHNGARYLVGGHHRYFAAQKLGINQLPVVKVDLPYMGYESINDLILSGKQPGWWKYFKP